VIVISTQKFSLFTDLPLGGLCELLINNRYNCLYSEAIIKRLF